MFADMPWWASGYLLIVLGLFLAGFFTEKPRTHHEFIGSAMSLFSICTFVVCFFNPEVFQLFGLLVIPMVLIGIYWEFIRAVQETSYAREMLSEEGDLSKGEQDFLLNVAIGFNAMIVVPGYVAGVILSLRAVGGM